MKIDALLDSNVIIAIVAEAHEHHSSSLALLDGSHAGLQFGISAHSYAEAYSVLTRRGEHGPFRFSPEEAWGALESVRAVTALLALTGSQSFDAIKSYSQAGGVGARLYDRLIGETAVANGIGAIVTWNLGHMRSLFPALRVTTPRQFVASAGR